MASRELLEKRQDLLKQQIAANLDLLIGTLAKSPAMRGHNLTTKHQGKTVTRYVRKDLRRQVQIMAARYQRVRRLLLQLSQVNWHLLQQSAD
jgi:hypothetical protein